MQIKLDDIQQAFITQKAEFNNMTPEQYLSALVSDVMARQKKPGASPEMRDFHFYLQNQMHDPIAREIYNVLDNFLKGTSMPHRTNPTLNPINLNNRIEIR